MVTLVREGMEHHHPTFVYLIKQLQHSLSFEINLGP